MKKERLLSLLCLVPIIFGFISCTKPVPPKPLDSILPDYLSRSTEDKSLKEKKFVVGVSWQGMTPYVKRLEKLLKKFSQESDYEIQFIFMDGQNNFEKQISQVENFIAHKADVILLNPSSYNELTPAVIAANNANIPIITIITRVRSQNKCTSYVGSDHKESAILQGTMVGQYLEGAGNIAILEGTVGIDAQIARTEGYQEILQQYPYLKVAVSQPAFWEQDEAYMIVENWLHSGVEFDAIMSQNDSMALGALAAVEEAGLADKIKIFGIDGDSDAVQSIKENGLEGTVFMDAYTQAKCIFKCFDLIKSGETPDKEYLVPFIVVNKENINNTSINSKLQY